MNLFLNWIENFTWNQALDLAIILFLAYELFRLVRGTSALNILLSIIGVYVCWQIALALEMPVVSGLLDRVISMGLLGIVVIFQPELRRFLFMLSTGAIRKQREQKLLKRVFMKTWGKRPLHITQIIQACIHMSLSRTGALIILTQQNKLPAVISTGERMDAMISSSLIENIFFKNSPLHDGAMIIENNKIIAARCILPVTTNKEVSANLGLRHRSAIGVTEQSDALAIIVSEETGSVSYCQFGEITYDVSPSQLRAEIEKFFAEAEEEMQTHHQKH